MFGMEIFFSDPNDIPLPPEEMQIRELVARPYPDGLRVRVYFEITPFQQRPDAELTIVDHAGEQVASVSVIETIDPKMDMTMHLRGPDPKSPLKLKAMLFYRQVDTDEESRESAEPPPSKPEILVVDQAETIFEIP